MTGPQYLLCGSRLTDDTYVLRLLLEGLNTWARQLSETITIQDNGSLTGRENEGEEFRYLAYRKVGEWEDPNVIFCFLDRLSQNRAAERLLQRAETEHRPAFIVSTYRGRETIIP